MKNIIKKYSPFLLISLMLLGCKKDFLDVKPIGVINSSSFYATKADAEAAVTAVYGMLNYMGAFDEWIMADLGSIASDDAEAGGNSPEDSPAFQNVDKFIMTPNIATDGYSEAYGVLYKGILYANLAIQNLPDIPKKDSAATQSFINTRLSEAKFLRALYYFYLVQVFGEIPVFDHVLGASEYNVTRSSLRSAFDLIESDLQDAIPNLPVNWPSVSFDGKHYAGTDVGRITKGAAQGLLAKVYLFESSYAHYYPNDNYSLVYSGQSRFKDLKEKWSDALSNAESVINSGQYKLVGIDGEKYSSWRSSNTDGYRFVWTTDGNNSKEAVFEIQNEYLSLGWLNTRGSAVVWWTGARWVQSSTGSIASPGFWGFNVPSENLVTEFNQEKRQATDPLYGTLTPSDPRFNVTIHKDTIGGNDSINYPNASSWSKISYVGTDATSYNTTKMNQAKYDCSYPEFLGTGANWSESPFNTRVLRYADVVLIAAEAAHMAGDNEKARTYLNMIRTRARMCGPAGNTCPADYAAGTTITMDMIIHERRLELAMEGHRFYDLVRWNLASERLNGMVLSTGFTVNYISPKNDFYPIPQSEVNASEGHLLQYQGW